jgi:hypothetical protein
VKYALCVYIYAKRVKCQPTTSEPKRMAAGSLVGCQIPIAEFSCAHGRPRCQGRRGEPFSERCADPVTRGSGMYGGDGATAAWVTFNSSMRLEETLVNFAPG